MAKKKKDKKKKEEKKPKVKKPTIAGYVRKAFEKNLNTKTDALIKEVKARFPDSAFSATHVAYYKNKLRKDGLEIPKRKKAAKKKKVKKT